jgi:hypothetical protein
MVIGLDLDSERVFFKYFHDLKDHFSIWFWLAQYGVRITSRYYIQQ